MRTGGVGCHVRDFGIQTPGFCDTGGGSDCESELAQGIPECRVFLEW